MCRYYLSAEEHCRSPTYYGTRPKKIVPRVSMGYIPDTRPILLDNCSTTEISEKIRVPVDPSINW